MDPYDDEDEEATAMAAAMGFSSFGSHKPPAKKRKFNPRTDAFVEGDALAAIDRGGKKGQGSGGNTMPLGKTRVLGVRKKEEMANEDEIALDDEEGGVRLGDGEDEGPQYMDTSELPPADGEEEEDGPRYIDTSLPPPIENGRGEGELGGPAYIYTSQPPPAAAVNDAEAREVQERIDAILASMQSPPDVEAPSNPIPPAPGTAPHGLPPKPAFGDKASMHGGPRGFGGQMGRGMSDTASVASSRPSGRGERNPDWYLGYYDPSFNENPWARIEKEMELEPVGTWLEGHGKGR
jgi:hypothetical protein